MPLLVRTVAGQALSAHLKHLASIEGGCVPVEAWGRQGWYCPICAAEHVVMRHARAAEQRCLKCGVHFWCRIVEADTLVTSTDDPASRPGGA